MKKIFLIATAIVLIFAALAFAGREVKQSVTENVMVFMTASSDHVAGATGKTLTIAASKNGAAFVSITPTVTERGDGWYNLALTASHTDTLKDLALHITCSGCDPTDKLYNVVANFEADTYGKVDTEVADILADTGELQTNQNWDVWDDGTRTLTDPDSYKADVSAVCVEANVEGHVTTSLNTYDPPTKAELDTAESNIRGADSDTLKTLSDALDAFDVSGLCQEATALIINTTVSDTNSEIKKGVRLRTR